MQNFFVYGTLLCSEIMEKLTGKIFNYKPAILPGFQIQKVSGQDYPAITEMAGSETPGMLIENVDDQCANIISFYEGDEYEKRMVRVFVNEVPVKASVFVWALEKSKLENKEWNLEYFRKNKLNYYLDKVIPVTIEEFYSNNKNLK